MTRIKSIRRRAAMGFTLIELTVVLFIIALITGAVTIPLATRIDSKKGEETNDLLKLAEVKLLAYASKFGYLPCPATATSFGQEPVGTNHTTGACPEWHGFLPAAALGWSPVDAQGFALDAWGTAGSRIRYAVANNAIDGITNPFTKINGLANAGVSPVSSAALLQVCGSGSGVTPGIDCGTAPTLAANAAIIVWSVGPNARSGGTSIDEAQNPNPNGGSPDRIFVSRARSAGVGAEFDDLVHWVSGAMVAGQLQTAGLMTPSGSGDRGSGGGCSSSNNSSSNSSTNTSSNSSSTSSSNSSNNSSSNGSISYNCSSSNNSSSNSSSNG